MVKKNKKVPQHINPELQGRPDGYVWLTHKEHKAEHDREKALFAFEEGHRQKHIQLHNQLDILVADFIANTKKLPSKTTIMELMEWSYKQTQPK